MEEHGAENQATGRGRLPTISYRDKGIYGAFPLGGMKVAIPPLHFLHRRGRQPTCFLGRAARGADHCCARARLLLSWVTIWADALGGFLWAGGLAGRCRGRIALVRRWDEWATFCTALFLECLHLHCARTDGTCASTDRRAYRLLWAGRNRQGGQISRWRGGARCTAHHLSEDFTSAHRTVGTRLEFHLTGQMEDSFCVSPQARFVSGGLYYPLSPQVEADSGAATRWALPAPFPAHLFPPLFYFSYGPRRVGGCTPLTAGRRKSFQDRGGAGHLHLPTGAGVWAGGRRSRTLSHLPPWAVAIQRAAHTSVTVHSGGHRQWVNDTPFRRRQEAWQAGEPFPRRWPSLGVALHLFRAGRFTPQRREFCTIVTGVGSRISECTTLHRSLLGAGQ